jgi:hypothetical protein
VSGRGLSVDLPFCRRFDSVRDRVAHQLNQCRLQRRQNIRVEPDAAAASMKFDRAPETSRDVVRGPLQCWKKRARRNEPQTLRRGLRLPQLAIHPFDGGSETALQMRERHAELLGGAHDLRGKLASGTNVACARCADMAGQKLGHLSRARQLLERLAQATGVNADFRQSADDHIDVADFRAHRTRNFFGRRR